MYSQRSLWNKINYKYTPCGVAILLCFIVAFLIYVIYGWMDNEKFQKNKLQTFAVYMSQYMDDVSKKLSDDDALATMNLFQFDNKMLSQFDWSSDTPQFSDIIGVMESLMYKTTQRKSVYYKSAHVWKILNHFLKTVAAKIPLPPKHQKQPWGDNWYQFSITYPLFVVKMAFAHRSLFGMRNGDVEVHLSAYVYNYFKSPPTPTGMLSMGWLRHGPNAIAMSVPYIAAHLLLRDYNPKDTICVYVKQALHFDFTLSGNGLRPDYGYIEHSNGRFMGYAYGVYPDARLLSKFYGIPNALPAIQQMFSIYEHPSLKVHFGPWFSRELKLTSNLTYTKYGLIRFHVVDSMYAVIAKTPDWMLEFNGQSKKLAFYEADKNNCETALYSLGARMLYYNDTDPKLYAELMTHYPGVISFNNKNLVINSKNITTETFTLREGAAIICSIRSANSQRSAIGIYNTYSTDFPDYKLDVAELMLITSQGYHVIYELVPKQAFITDNDLRVSVNMGVVGSRDIETPFGVSYGLANDLSIVYGLRDEDGIKQTPKVQVKSVKHPKDGGAVHSVQIIPIRFGRRNNHTIYKCAFSTIHGGETITELLNEPSTNIIATPEFKLEYNRIENHLCLFDVSGRRVAVSKVMDQNMYQDKFIIEESILLKTFGADIRFGELSKIEKNNTIHLVKNTKNRYQIIANNIDVSSIDPKKENHSDNDEDDNHNNHNHDDDEDGYDESRMTNTGGGGGHQFSMPTTTKNNYY